MKNILRIIDQYIFFPPRVKRLKEILIPYLKNVKYVLDVGSGNGEISHQIENALRVKIIGVDKKIQTNTAIKVQKYMGDKLPFITNEFDAAMMIDVLHHSKTPEKILKEARRVSKKYLIIKDHYWESKIDYWLLMLADYVGNAPFGIDNPYNFQNLENWDKLFKDSRLKVTSAKKFKLYWFEPIKHVVFKLRKLY